MCLAFKSMKTFCYFCICSYLLKAPAGQRIRLTFNQKFRVTCNYFNQDGTCDVDWVEIRSKINNIDINGARYCCTNLPSIVESDSNEMLVLFYSKATTNLDSIGFQAHFTFFGGTYY
jgi:hypothetical protein